MAGPTPDDNQLDLHLAAADRLEAAALDPHKVKDLYDAAKTAAEYLSFGHSSFGCRILVANELVHAVLAHDYQPDLEATRWLQRAAVAASALLRATSEPAHQNLHTGQLVLWLNDFGDDESIGFVAGVVLGELLPRGLDSARPEDLTRRYQLLIESPWGGTEFAVNAAAVVAVPAHLNAVVDAQLSYRINNPARQIDDSALAAVADSTVLPSTPAAAPQATTPPPDPPEPQAPTPGPAF
ncbi:hypothetical protein ACIGO9_29760 [Nocardia asteroides]|uniref:hypothetical protein n=1 Tax=Nocardia asteroides TaxID=1824 RepID=UPI0037C93C99